VAGPTLIETETEAKEAKEAEEMLQAGENKEEDEAVADASKAGGAAAVEECTEGAQHATVCAFCGF